MYYTIASPKNKRNPHFYGKLSFTSDCHAERSPIGTKSKHLDNELYFPHIVYTHRIRKARTRFTYMLFLMIKFQNIHFAHCVCSVAVTRLTICLSRARAKPSSIVRHDSNSINNWCDSSHPTYLLLVRFIAPYLFILPRNEK